MYVDGSRDSQVLTLSNEEENSWDQMDIERDFKDTLELSQKITLEDVKHFNVFTKILGHIIRLVAPLL